MNPRQRATLAAAVLIAALLFAFAGDGLAAYFTPDDMMNLYFAWSAPVWQADRPLGALFYKGMLGAFGLNPLPYRVAAYALLVANLWLLYCVCLRLSRSREVAALACLLAAYHAHLADLYYSTGTIYDLLCFFFLFAALARYLKLRETGLPGWRETAGLLGLFTLALDSKEMAATLPLLVALYEAIYRRGEGWRRFRFAALALPLSGATALLKLVGAHRMTANQAYALHFDAHTFLVSWRHYLDQALYGAVRVNTLTLALFFAALLAVGWLARRREVVFGAAFFFVAMLPVAFIAERGLFAAYCALPGFYLSLAGTLCVARDWSLRAFPRAAAWFGVRPAQAALFLLVMVALIPLHQGRKWLASAWAAEAHAMVRAPLAQLARTRPPLSRGAKVLILSDPYPKDEWMLTFMFRLLYRDDSLRVDRAKVWPQLALEPERSAYQRLFVVDEKGMREQPK